MKTFKFSLVLRTRENTDVFISLDDNIYGIHRKRVNILYESFLFELFKFYLDRSEYILLQIDLNTIYYRYIAPYKALFRLKVFYFFFIFYKNICCGTLWKCFMCFDAGLGGSVGCVSGW